MPRYATFAELMPCVNSLCSAPPDDFSSDSDIDVLIDMAPEARVGLLALQKMRDELAGIFGRPVDLLTRDGVNRYIRAQILSDAEIVHAE